MSYSYLNKIEKLIHQKIEENQNLSFPCKYMVFHQANKYCQECEDFICNKCIKKHDKTHTVLSIHEITKNGSEKINLYSQVLCGKLPKDESSIDSTEKVEIDEKVEQNAIETIDNLINKLTCIKKKMEKFFELRKQLLKKYNSEEHNIVYEDKLMERITEPEKLEIKEIDEKEIKNIHDNIKFESNNTIVLKTFLDFCKELDKKIKEIIMNNNYKKKLSNKDNLSVYERINLKTNELNLIMSDFFIQKVDSFLNKSIPQIDQKILSTEDVFKNVICAYLKIEDEEYNSLLEKTEIEDEPKKIIEKIVEVPKEVEVEKIVEVPKEVEVEKIVEKKVEIKKTKYNNDELSINDKNKINFSILFKVHDFDNPDLYENVEDDGNLNINEENKDTENTNTKSNNLENKKKGGLKRSQAIQRQGEIGAYASLSLSTQNVKDIIKGTYNEAKAVIVTKDNKFLMDSIEEIEEYHKSCNKKLNNLNLNKVKEGFDLNKELSGFTWKERNMFELIFPAVNHTYMSIYNPYINKIEEIEIQTDQKFPSNIALLYKLPYLFVSVG